jgi:hypothetical protein
LSAVCGQARAVLLHARAVRIRSTGREQHAFPRSDRVEPSRRTCLSKQQKIAQLTVPRDTREYVDTNPPSMEEIEQQHDEIDRLNGVDLNPKCGNTCRASRRSPLAQGRGLEPAQMRRPGCVSPRRLAAVCQAAYRGAEALGRGGCRGARAAGEPTRNLASSPPRPCRGRRLDAASSLELRRAHTAVDRRGIEAVA